MLPKSQRLNLRTEFSWVASGQKTEHPLYKVFYRFGVNTTPKVGVAIRSSDFKKSVQRSQVKRLIFSGLELVYQKLRSDINIVVIPRERVLSLEKAELVNSLEEVFIKHKLFK